MQSLTAWVDNLDIHLTTLNDHDRRICLDRAEAQLRQFREEGRDVPQSVVERLTTLMTEADDSLFDNMPI